MSGSTSNRVGVGDIFTDDGLRAALRRVMDGEGWDSPVGQLVVDALRAMSHRWTVPHADVVDPHRLDHLVGLAWEMLVTYPEKVVSARSPWGMINVALWHRACSAALADELGVSERHARQLMQSNVRSRLQAGALHTTVRLGEGTTFERASTEPAARRDPVGDEALGNVHAEPTEDWDEALRLLQTELVEAGVPPEQTVEAIQQVIEVIAAAHSRSYMHTEVYRSPQLAGLDHAQRRALAELLIGTRRGGAADSAWWTLRCRLADGERPQLRAYPKFAARVAKFAAPFVDGRKADAELRVGA
ncbi:hypothetical protein [Phytoactinopolyspora mesophila]|uniref:Uncharacterized protein n=1 Tax=Phytoactinopolyspora mesophila TaxID=2650750 RepID=A0A7K3M1S1_9ACTN|nr:hypothetical protein [Phytoactinopolyspora mesophila]NDL56987.1 hypothetical protein [Phytoactinopolyspora mesophila]